MNRRSTQERLLAVAANQMGVAGRAQLIRSGVNSATVDHCVRAKRLLPVFRAVYSVGREVEMPESVWWAATIAGGSGAVLSGRTAARAWGLLGDRCSMPSVLEVARNDRVTRTLRGKSPRLKGTQLHLVRRSLRPGDVGAVMGIPVMTPGRLLVDLASHAPVDLRSAFFEASRLRLVDKRQIAWCLQRSVGLPGSAEIRELARLWVPEMALIRSVLEGQFLLAWVESGGPMPMVNVKVGPWEVDFLWGREKVVVEVDGRAYHDHPAARDRDARKDAWLKEEGFTVLRFSSAQVNDPRAGAVRKVARELGEARVRF